jgi:hypothetical protein
MRWPGCSDPSVMVVGCQPSAFGTPSRMYETRIAFSGRGTYIWQPQKVGEVQALSSKFQELRAWDLELGRLVPCVFP